MGNRDMVIRSATKSDFDALYKLGAETPEFRVSRSGAWMDPDEFMSAIENPSGTFLLAESEGGAAGFIYANRQDPERGPKTKAACLVYLVVRPEHRKQKIGQQLWDACLGDLKKHIVTYVYGWANAESDGSMVGFLKKNGFSEGHKYAWMDKEI
ncbi:MAG: GNAT family N-acetyltransferase [Candidatus Liptonbacteria bacterium]|nr:GNAT family N-acetyltransferase [Candidatus Liptonbacteria bacterium]